MSKEPESVMYYVDVLPSTQDQLKVFEARFVSEIEEKDPLKVAIQLKAMEDLVKNLRKNNIVRDHIMNEAEKHPDKTFKYNGAEFEKAETGVVYDYSKCEDEEYVKLEKEFTEAKDKLDKRKKLLQKGLVDEDTGEIIKALRISNSYVKISLK